MDKVKNSFDDFTFHARVMPVLVALLPAMLYIIVKGMSGGSVEEIVSNTIIVFVALTISSKVAREFGKNYEEKMYKKLNGKPTTICLRFSNDSIDTITKARYHKKLSDCVENLELPKCIEEEDEASDEQYESAVIWLKEYANRNREKEPRVYQELKEYNFWRNLYGTKYIAIIIYMIMLVIEVIQIKTFSIKELLATPYPKYAATLMLFISIMTMLLFINAKTVDRKAFDYAKTLLRACENIKVD